MPNSFKYTLNTFKWFLQAPQTFNGPTHLLVCVFNMYIILKLIYLGFLQFGINAKTKYLIYQIFYRFLNMKRG